MKTAFSILFVCLFTSGLMFAQDLGNPVQKRKGAPQQPAQTCATDEVAQNMFRQNPASLQLHQSMEREYRRRIQELGDDAYQRMGGDPILTIPVVVHIVHRTGIPIGTEENLTDADITNVINELNDRYAHASGLSFANPFSGITLDIELCLAQRDPWGNFTTGIVRHADNTLCENDMDTYNTQLSYYWNTTQYMNIYIVRSITGSAAGYATMAGSHGFNGDGVVMLHSAWWSGLLAHESGHYFNLEHNFQGGCPNNNCLTNGDFVCDTPPKATPGGAGAGCAPSNSCSTDTDDTSTNNPFRPIGMGGLGDVTDSNENYMDYSGGCWNAYTAGQRTRMRTAITTTRASLLANNFCFFTNNDAGITAVIQPGATVCQPVVTPVVTLRNFGAVNLTSVSITATSFGGVLYTYNWAGSLAPDATTNVTLPNITLLTNSNDLGFFTSLPNGVADGYAANDAIAYTVTWGGNSPPLSQNFDGAFPPVLWSIENPDALATWQQSSTVCYGNSAYINNFNYNGAGSLDHLNSQMVSLAGLGSASLSFDVAYAIYSASYTDGLRVAVSTDCGANFTEVFNKSGSVLATAPATTSNFVPSDCSQWRNETIDLSDFVGNDVIVRFTNVNGWGNNLYIDNVNLTGAAVPGGRVQVSIYLQGAYNPFVPMSTTLRNLGYLPTSQPYGVSPFFHFGGESVASIPPGVVDWVLLTIRSADGSTNVKRACFLRNDGLLIDLDGTEGVLFATGLTAGASYFVDVAHRNHFRVFSRNAISLPNSVALDLTNPANADPAALIWIGESGYYIVGGNCEYDRVISYADYNHFIQVFSTAGGGGNYNNADVNLDGQVNISDFNIIRQNAGLINLYMPD